MNRKRSPHPLHHSHTTCTFWVLLSREWIDLASVRVDQVPILLGWFESGRREAVWYPGNGDFPSPLFSRSTPVTDRHLSPRLSMYGVVYLLFQLHYCIRMFVHALSPNPKREGGGGQTSDRSTGSTETPSDYCTKYLAYNNTLHLKSSHARKQASK